ncbi:MAG: T9SS type A sorting domain-containing protein [Prevotellaceae bacterium]|jgi:hypothetical protein|nr:T9SS type A sorting domain-containing protein [Prevotellaceae bacterium]
MKRTLLFILLFISSLAFSAEHLLAETANFQGKEVNLSESIHVSFANGKLSVENAPVNAPVEIFSMLGVSIFRSTTTENKQYFLLDLKKGYYIIKVGTTTKKISVK